MLSGQDDDGFTIEERSINFKELHREMTDEAIATTILDGWKNLGLKCEYLRGQGYDGSGSMVGEV